MTSVGISVIIPVYNALPYLYETIDSLLKQSYRRIEIICVDDASSDGSYHAIEEYALKDKRVKFVRLNENHGQAYARNCGVSLSNGEYIFFMDSDDFLSSNSAFEELFREADKYQVDCLLFDADVIYESEDLKRKYPDYHLTMWEKYPDTYVGMDLFKRFIKNGDFHPAVWQQFWRADFLRDRNELFYPDTSPVEDLLFTFQNLILCKKVRHTNHKFYTYRCRNGSSLNSNFTEKKFRAYCSCYYRAMDFIREYSFNESLAESFAIYLNEIKCCLIKGARELLFQGIDITKMEFSDPFYKLGIQILMRDGLLYANHVFTVDEYHMLKECKQVIVYGAGNLGKETVQNLESIGIKNYKVAITQKQDSLKFLNGKKIFCLEDLQHCADSSVVLLAVSPAMQKEMRTEMDRLGFKRWINMYR